MNNTQVAKYVKALKHRNRDVRWQAADALMKIGDAAAVPALIEALKDEGENVRWRAAGALGKIGIPAVPALIKALTDWDMDVREQAASALGQIGDSETLPRTILAASQLSARTKIEVLDALRHIPDYHFDDTPTLCQKVLKEDDTVVHVGAQAVLDLLMLVRASQRDTASEPQELLRASPGGTSDAQPETLMRGAGKPRVDARKPTQPPTLREWLFGKRKDEFN